jgi:NADH dehydrogenase [ubiquinone] 1 alpha subcomplex assembly factor 7
MRLGLAQNLPKFQKISCVPKKKFSTKNESDELKKFEGMSKKLEEMNKRFETISVVKPDTPYYVNNETAKKSTPMTPFMKHLTMMIKIGGPVTVATFMREALTNPTFGYYMQKPEVIGPLGDFTTSPEISQVFGDLLGLWCVRMWENLGSPKKLQLIEFGPGKGTLMNDMLKAFKKFHKFMAAVEINLIEISPTMRKIQAKTLGVAWEDHSAPTNMEKVNDTVGQKSKLKMPRFTKDPEQKEAPQPFKVEKNPVIQDVTVIRNDGIRINWKQNLEDVDSGPCLIVAHEFFDALPVHQFQYSQGKWLERLVDLDHSGGEDYLKFSLSPAPTILSQLFTSQKDPNRPDPVEGEIMEVSPQTLSIAQNIGTWIDRNEGSALIIDYGYNYASGFSLRAIKNHQFMENVLRSPGEVDLTCNVDFKALLSAARQSKTGSVSHNIPNQNIMTHGPITQGEFLMSLGIETRVLNLLKKIEDEEKAESLISAFDRLISDDKMGKIYKVATISSKNLAEVSGLYDASVPPPSPSQEQQLEAENKS